MECNKDEATRAKEIAEKKFTAKDIAGAKKFASKAQNLYPGLEGIPQLLATLDVYISAQNKMFGEADWYGILAVSPKADDETVRKQYRKLALMLHPDKNKSVGAEGAFKLVSEAWSLLSDKAKRTAYDQKRNVTVTQQKVQPPSKGPSASPSTNGFYNFSKTKSTSTSAKAQKGTSRGASSYAPPPPHKRKLNTFWTVCHRCKMHYEYLRVYLNHNLLCPNCHEPFFAIEIEPPPTNGSKWDTSQQPESSNYQTASNNSNFQWGSFSRTTGASTAAQAATVVQQAYEKVKREREEAQAANKREEALKRKSYASKKSGSLSYTNNAKRRRGMDDTGLGNNSRATKNGIGTARATASSISGSRQSDFEAARVGGINKPSGRREVAQLEIQKMLMMKARVAIRKKLSEWNSTPVVSAAVKEVKNGSNKATEKDEQKDIDFLNGEKDVRSKSFEPVLTRSDIKPFVGSYHISSDAEVIESMSINVPDPDFHDFDKDRTERSFGENQVWAAYDDDDGMPRYYALIHNVISLNPFKMKISWLNSKTNSELGPLDWVGSGFSKTCGDFRVGRHDFNNSINSFSHMVKWSKGSQGAIQIYPRKGHAWALYRNWSPCWTEVTVDELKHKYEMVEVLEDYHEELGVSVIPLVKVAGFKTVFHQHLDPREIRRIPREEMFRLSHCVPSYLLTGQEAPNAPRGCRELDPAATPLELLQVITDAKEGEIVQNEGQALNENGANVEKINDGEVLEILQDGSRVGNENGGDIQKANYKKMAEDPEIGIEEIISGYSNSRETQEVEILEKMRKTERNGAHREKDV